MSHSSVNDFRKSWTLHIGVIILLFALQFILPAYHHGNLARVMVLACYAMGYNILFGYTGLLSLGHALFFAAGMYGMSLTIQHLGWSAGPALLSGLVQAAPLVGDRRRLMLTPTEEGRTLYAELVAKASEVTRQTTAPLGSQEQDRLIKLLERLV